MKTVLQSNKSKQIRYNDALKWFIVQPKCIFDICLQHWEKTVCVIEHHTLAVFGCSFHPNCSQICSRLSEREGDQRWWIMPLSTNWFLHQNLSYSWPWLLKRIIPSLCQRHQNFYTFCSIFLFSFQLWKQKIPHMVDSLCGIRFEFKWNSTGHSTECHNVA